MIKYDYIVVGAGIAGCSISHFLQNDNVLLIDKNQNVACGASGAAGAFLSPLLGKDNNFKDLVNQSLKYTISFYEKLLQTKNISQGILRIPKNEEDKKKFKEFTKNINFTYKEIENGLFFDIGTHINPNKVCELLTQNIEKKFNYEITSLEYIDNLWVLNNELSTKKLILTTGINTGLIPEKYFNLRAVWGQKINITSTSCISINYHKHCSLSVSKLISDEEEAKPLYNLSIGATHRRFDEAREENKYLNMYSYNDIKRDTIKLLKQAKEIYPLKDIQVTDIRLGARSSSIDYFPIVGRLIDSKKTISLFPYLKHGVNIEEDKFEIFDNLYVLNGLGGRGFVLAPFLADKLIKLIKMDRALETTITANRLFKKWVKKHK